MGPLGANQPPPVAVPPCGGFLNGARRRRRGARACGHARLGDPASRASIRGESTTRPRRRRPVSGGSWAARATREAAPEPRGTAQPRNPPEAPQCISWFVANRREPSRREQHDSRAKRRDAGLEPRSWTRTGPPRHASCGSCPSSSAPELATRHTASRAAISLGSSDQIASIPSPVTTSDVSSGCSWPEAIDSTACATPSASSGAGKRLM